MCVEINNEMQKRRQQGNIITPGKVWDVESRLADNINFRQEYLAKDFNNGNVPRSKRIDVVPRDFFGQLSSLELANNECSDKDDKRKKS